MWGGVQLQAVRAGLEDAGGEEKEGMRGCPGRMRGFEGMGGSEGWNESHRGRSRYTPPSSVREAEMLLNLPAEMRKDSKSEG